VISDVAAPVEHYPVSYSNLLECSQSSDAEASGTWTDYVYLSNDAVVGNDQIVGAFTFTGSIAAGSPSRGRKLSLCRLR